MKENIIKLELDSTISGLAGNDYGYEIYLKQVKEKFNWNGINIIVFPNYIERVAISFVQGFSREILEKIKKSDIDNFIKIESKNDYLSEKIVNNMKF